MGVRRWADPALTDDVEFVPVDIDPREPHWYAAEWTPERVMFYIDEERVRVVEQSPSYPLQSMLSFYEFGNGAEPVSPREAYPKVAVIDRFLGWRPVAGAGARPPDGSSTYDSHGPGPSS